MMYQGLSFLYKQETIYNNNSELLTCQTITKQDVYASSLCNYVIWFPNSSACWQYHTMKMCLILKERYELDSYK